MPPVNIKSGRDGIMPEIYAVSAEYQATLSRLAAMGTRESDITDDQYAGALRALVIRAVDMPLDATFSNKDKRKALTDVAVLAIRWARNMRVA